MEVDRLIEWLERHFPEHALELTIVDYMRFMLSEHNTRLSAWSNQPSLRQELYTEGIPTRQCTCSTDNSPRRSENLPTIDDFCDRKQFVLYLLEKTHQDKTAADRKCQRVCCTP